MQVLCTNIPRDFGLEAIESKIEKQMRQNIKSDRLIPRMIRKWTAKLNS